MYACVTHDPLPHCSECAVRCGAIQEPLQRMSSSGSVHSTHSSHSSASSSAHSPVLMTSWRLPLPQGVLLNTGNTSCVPSSQGILVCVWEAEGQYTLHNVSLGTAASLPLSSDSRACPSIDSSMLAFTCECSTHTYVCEFVYTPTHTHPHTHKHTLTHILSYNTQEIQRERERFTHKHMDVDNFATLSPVTPPAPAISSLADPLSTARESTMHCVQWF